MSGTLSGLHAGARPQAPHAARRSPRGLTPNPANPDSATVGSSGRNDDRSPLVTASARRMPVGCAASLTCLEAPGCDWCIPGRPRPRRWARPVDCASRQPLDCRYKQRGDRRTLTLPSPSPYTPGGFLD